MSSEQNHNLQTAIIFIVTGSAFGAACNILAKIAQSDLFGEPLHPLQVSHGRFLFAFLTISIFAIVKRQKFTKPNLPLHAFRTFCGYSGISLMFAATALIPISDATALGFLNPIFGLFFAIPILKEKIGKLRWLATVIGFIGAMILIRPSNSTFEPGAIFALIAALSIGLELVLIKFLTKKEKPVQILLINNAIGLTISTVVMLNFWAPPTIMQWVILAGIGIFMITTQTCNIYALRNADASFIVPFTFSNLIFVSIYDYLVFSSYPDYISIIGSTVILSGVGLIAWHEIKKHKKIV